MPVISKHRNTGSQTWCNSTQFPAPGLLHSTAHIPMPGLSTWLRYSCPAVCTKSRKVMSCPAQGQRSARSWSRFLWNFQGCHNFPYLRDLHKVTESHVMTCTRAKGGETILKGVPRAMCWDTESKKGTHWMSGFTIHHSWYTLQIPNDL